MASIEEVRPGVFRVRVRVKDPATGVWGWSSKNIQGNKREAQKAARDMEGGKDRSQLRPGRAPTIESFAESWLAGIKPTVAYETHRGYSVNVHRHIVPYLGKLRLRDLTTTTVKEFMGHMLEEGLASRTVQYARAVLHMIMESALPDGLVQRNVVKDAKPPVAQHSEKVTLNKEQVSLLVEAASKTRLIAPVVLAARNGLRRGEVCGLRWEDLDLDDADGAEMTINRTLQRQTGKGLQEKSTKSDGSHRRIPVLPSAVPYLKRWRAEQRKERMAAGPAWRGTSHVCTTLDGGPLDPQELDRSFRRLVNSIGLPPVTFHGLRHTFATLAIQNGADFKWVQYMLGHKTAAFTLDTYAHVTAASLRGTAKALDARISGE